MYECIVNPSSRSGRGRKIWEELRKCFEAKGASYHVHFTDGPGGAIRIARELTEGSVGIRDGGRLKLVVLGGDGSLNEVVSGIADFSRVLLAYVPTGSSNDFARGIGLNINPGALFDRILEGERIRSIDVGKLTYHHQTKTLSRLHDNTVENVRHFLVSAGIGFDAAVCEEALASGTKNLLNRIGLGKLTYGAIAVREIMRADRVGITVTPEGAEEIALPHFIFAALMLLPYEGGGFRFAPDAEPADGLFNLCMAGDISKPAIVRELPLAYLGRHYGRPGFYHLKTPRVRIRTELPMWVHTDGEVMMKSDDISLECLPQALAMMV